MGVMQNKWHLRWSRYLSFQGCFSLLVRMHRGFTWMTLLVLPVALYWALCVAPADLQQGEGYRILYVHVPCAFGSLFAYALMGIFSLIYLIWRIRVCHILAESIFAVGWLCATLALITGSIWGKPMWGTWWVWDARLTSELILFFLYLSYYLVAEVISESKERAKIQSYLALIGLIDLPIIHYSVVWWHTLHQGASVLKGAMAPEMLWPLIFMLIAFFSLGGVVVCLRAKTRLMLESRGQKWLKEVA